MVNEIFSDLASIVKSTVSNATEKVKEMRERDKTIVFDRQNFPSLIDSTYVNKQMEESLTPQEIPDEEPTVTYKNYKHFETQMIKLISQST